MYYFKPTENGECFSYTAYDNEQEAGFCKCRLKDDTLILESAEFLSEEIFEGLVRSSLNYGANRGAYIAIASPGYCDNVLKRLGFSQNDRGEYSGEIPELLSSCSECLRK